jgi:hypothetical protein
LRNLIHSVACAVAIIGSILPYEAFAWQSTAAQTMALQQYLKTAPYVDLPLPELKKTIGDLNGIKLDSTPGQLDLVLNKTGEAIASQLPRVPNLICREDVADEAPPKQGGSGGMSQVSARVVGAIPGRGMLTQTPPPMKSLVPGDWHHFEYIIHANKEADGTTTLEESRTGKGGGATTDPKGIGFAPLWLIFAAGNRSESNFHYLGTQKVEGHATYVVAFAQRPGQVRKPSLLATATDTIPLLYQGIAWIDAQDFQILRLRTDLLAPLPELNLKRVTSTIEYTKVHIPELAEPLWLPHEVEVVWETNGEENGELHRYAKYQLFRATIKLRP